VPKSARRWSISITIMMALITTSATTTDITSTTAEVAEILGPCR